MVVNCIMYHHTKCYVLYVLQLTLYSNKGSKSSTVFLLLPIPKQSSIALFADDAKCHKQIRTINDCVLLHNDLILLLSVCSVHSTGGVFYAVHARLQ